MECAVRRSCFRARFIPFRIGERDRVFVEGRLLPLSLYLAPRNAATFSLRPVNEFWLEILVAPGTNKYFYYRHANSFWRDLGRSSRIRFGARERLFDAGPTLHTFFWFGYRLRY